MKSQRNVEETLPNQNSNRTTLHKKKFSLPDLSQFNNTSMNNPKALNFSDIIKTIYSKEAGKAIKSLKTQNQFLKSTLGPDEHQ